MSQVTSNYSFDIPSLSLFKSVILTETTKKVMDFALYGVRFALASGFIVFGLSQLFYLNFFVSAVTISLGMASLFHTISDLTKKPNSTQLQNELNENFNNISKQAEKINNLTDDQAKHIKETDVHLDSATEIATQIEERAHHANDKIMNHLAINIKEEIKGAKDANNATMEINVQIKNENEKLKTETKKAQNKAKEIAEAKNLETNVMVGAGIVAATAVTPIIGRKPGAFAAILAALIAKMIFNSPEEKEKLSSLTPLDQILLVAAYRKKLDNTAKENLKKYAAYRLEEEEERVQNEAAKVAANMYGF